MKILWLDDKSYQEGELQTFMEEWRLSDRKDDVLTAVDGPSAIVQLRRHPDVGLLILDLLWGAQPEHSTVTPMGIEYLKNIRESFPLLRVATRSVIKDPALLATLVQYFVDLHVHHHFISHMMDSHSDWRRQLFLRAVEHEFGTMSTNPQQHMHGTRCDGDYWGAVLFADISGFTAVTEQLWLSDLEPLFQALDSFYDLSIRAVTANGGIVDKLIGDEIMGLFLTKPKDGEEAIAIKAVDAAREILNGFREVERKLVAATNSQSDHVGTIKWKLKAGIEGGALRISSKPLPSGEIEYCTTGIAANLASRIKGAAGAYSIVIGPGLRYRLPSRPLYESDPIPVGELKGIQRDIKVYALRDT